MFGIRFTPLIRKSAQLCYNTVVLPKFQFSLANKYFSLKQINNQHSAEDIPAPIQYPHQESPLNALKNERGGQPGGR